MPQINLGTTMASLRPRLQAFRPTNEGNTSINVDEANLLTRMNLTNLSLLDLLQRQAANAMTK